MTVAVILATISLFLFSGALVFCAAIALSSEDDPLEPRHNTEADPFEAVVFDWPSGGFRN